MSVIQTLFDNGKYNWANSNAQQKTQCNSFEDSFNQNEKYEVRTAKYVNSEQSLLFEKAFQM